MLQTQRDWLVRYSERHNVWSTLHNKHFEPGNAQNLTVSSGSDDWCYTISVQSFIEIFEISHVKNSHKIPKLQKTNYKWQTLDLTEETFWCSWGSPCSGQLHVHRLISCDSAFGVVPVPCRNSINLSRSWTWDIYRNWVIFRYQGL